MLADWRTAPVGRRVRAALGFLEKLTLHPEHVTAEDAREAMAGGASAEALRDAVFVCALFNLIVRVADALGIEALPPDQLDRGAQFIVDAGYDRD